MFNLPEPFACRCACRLSRTLRVAALSAAALAALPAAAQGSGAGAYGSGTGSTSSGSATGTPGAMSGTATGARLARNDLSMMTDLAQANIAEIETGKLALEKSRNDQVKKFAQEMIDDHTAALQQLQTLAQAKGVTLTGETDLQHKTRATAMRALSGDTFDSQYLKRVGVNDHQRTLQLLEKAQRSSTDPDLKAMAGKMIPTVQDHLQMAQQMTQQMASKTGSARSGNR